MGDLINRKALLETIGKLKVDYYIDMHGKYNPVEQATKIINCIEDAPTVEAKPVVHCRDCCFLEVCKTSQWLGLDGYCSRGEKHD